MMNERFLPLAMLERHRDTLLRYAADLLHFTYEETGGEPVTYLYEAAKKLTDVAGDLAATIIVLREREERKKLGEDGAR